jgi:signal transduction histidine kinase
MSRAADLRRCLLARRAYLVHAALALLLVLLTIPRMRTEELRQDESILALWWTCTAAIVIGLLVQHRWPSAALVLTSAGTFAHAMLRGLGDPGFPLLIHLAVPITLYTLASRSRSRRTLAVALAVLIAAVIAVTLLGPPLAGEPPPEAGPPGVVKEPSVRPEPGPFEFVQHKVLAPGLTMLLAVALAYALGEGTRSRRAHVRTLEQRAADAEREQRQRVALATATERARISRDLHDVLAHSLSVIVAQAQAAIAAQHRHPDRTTQAMREVITVGRDSLTELRRIIGTFGPDADHGVASPIGLAALPAMLDRVRTAGVPVRFACDDPTANLPSGVDLSAYRIVQEALTNTLKHAGPGATASVRLAASPEYLDLEITDDGAGPPTHRSGSGSGNGLRGIAERVALHGGTLTVGPVPGGGFAVRARLPLAPDRNGAPR